VLVATQTQQKFTNSRNKTEIREVKQITAYGAPNGNLLGRGTLDERSGFAEFKTAAEFTPHGDYLLLPTFHYRDGLFIQAVSTSSGSVRMVNVPVKKDERKSWQLTLAVPQEPTLLVHSHGGTKDNPGGVTAHNLRSGTEKPIRALTVDPWNLFNRGVQLSPDGALLLSQGLHALQVCDWRADRRLLDLKIGENLQSYQNGRFTPDGKRVFVQWKPSFHIIRNGERQTYSRIWLYDIVSQKQIAEFTPEKHGLAVEINALTISRDGKTLVWGHGTSVIAMDFQAMFGIAPLPPAARPGLDVLPLK
jgi:hypothetical protein